MIVTSGGHVSTSHLLLPNIDHAQNLSIRLVLVSQLCDFGLKFIFTPSGCLVQDLKTNETLGIGHRVGRLFEVTCLRLPDLPSNFVASTSSLYSFNM